MEKIKESKAETPCPYLRSSNIGEGFICLCGRLIKDIGICNELESKDWCHHRALAENVEPVVM
ncbi:MAG: hypothetical protein A2452_07345 [Candidatus Firestonebacteria bacterium RIFOXYC2_FULL_39_67]|nr:MAG: hypothetical protein A2452_07345 [Candidatus Firestonebacteria bacterium RIFOXYC2_FULL_39_67]